MQTTIEDQRLGDATYSPEDNKIRFYPVSRLSKEDYTRARAAGFIWAPKQELFVAPMWTPDREDLMLEWCGELGDEDKSLVERAEERSERFEDYSERRAEDADRAHKGVAAIADNIPLGQPILVGHHSERRARKDAERIENGMRKAVKMWDQSKYWTDRAQSAIRHAKYLERPDVRARRIKKLEAELRKAQRGLAECERGIRIWEKVGDDLDLARRVANGSNEGWLFCIEVDGLRFHACDVLRPDGERHEKCPAMSPAEVLEIARKCYTGGGVRYNRWIAHYENRLAYERAMLAEAGGTATDRKGPEKGGACKCWASHRGGYSYIEKVNKVSVTVLDNWGNGGANFTRTIPFDKLSCLMSAAEVQSARDCGTLIEYGDKTGFCLRGNGNDGEVERASAETAEQRRIRLHVSAIRNSGGLCDCKDCQAAGVGQGGKFEAMRETLKNGIKVVAARNLFPTPPPIAEQLADLADLFAGAKVLEPSSGTGALLKRIIERGIFASDITAIEINRDLAAALEPLGCKVVCGDFLELAKTMPAEFDRVVMNPPFDHGSDIEHVKAAFGLLAPGGVLVAIVAAGPAQEQAFDLLADKWIELPAGSFSDQGTRVNTAIVVLNKPA